MERIDENIVVEEDIGPWGVLVVLAEKPHQENVPCHEYQSKLCVSYRKLNQVTRTFTSPLPCCDDAVQDIDTEEKYLISVEWTLVIFK